jgi:hypothetical protein
MIAPTTRVAARGSAREQHADAAARAHPAAASERPARAILGDLWQHTETLVSQEFQLARGELQAELLRAKRDLVAATVSGVVAFAGALSVVAAAILWLARYVDSALSALIVGALLLGAGFFLYERSKRDLAKLELPPPRTEQSVQRSLRSVQHNLHEPQEATQ